MSNEIRCFFTSWLVCPFAAVRYGGCAWVMTIDHDNHGHEGNEVFRRESVESLGRRRGDTILGVG